MNQEKIGKFIMELRKEKNMTQQELANKLGVTDRAISKWENGRGMPDLSLMKPLCDNLDININELLSGERIDKKEYKEKCEENVLNTIDYSKKKIKKTRNTFIMILSIILIFLILIITLFIIDINRMRNNEPVFFSSWGFDYIPPINLDTEKITIAIEDYIITKGDEKKQYKNEKTFVSMKTYLVDELKENKLYYIYAWVLEESYYIDNNQIKQNTGASIPHKFIVEKTGDKFKVNDYIIPRDGSYYEKDMKNIFPRSIRKEMEKVHEDGTIEKLQLENKRQSELYFHK